MKKMSLLALASVFAVGCELDAHHLTTDPDKGGAGGSAQAGAGGSAQAGAGGSAQAGAGGGGGVTGNGGAAGIGAQGGSGGGNDGLLVDIPPEVIANRLSRLIWNKAADEATVDNVIRRRPRTLAAVREIALDMLKHPQAAERVAGFFPWWLDLGKTAALIESREKIPTATAQSLAKGMQDQLVGYVDDVIFDGTRTNSLSRMFVDANGVLEQPAFVARASGATAPYSITQRGIFARQRLTCEELPPPPAGVEFFPPDLSATLTLRQRLEKTVAQVACAGCHAFVDPIGGAFEHFDGLGTRRTTVPPGQPVDATGFMSDAFSSNAPDQTLRFNGIAGPGGFGSAVLGTQKFANCWTRQWAAYLLGRASVNDLGETQGLPTNLLAPPYDGDVLKVVAGVIASPGVLFGL